MIRIFLLDDHELTRTGFRHVLGAQPDFEIVGDAGSGEEALVQLRRLLPDILLCDLYLPGGISGLEVTERIVRSGLPTRVIVLSAQQEGPLPRRLMEAGAWGYLSKGSPLHELQQAIRVVMRGRRFIGGSVAQQIALGSLDGESSPFEALSGRELEVILLMLQGQRLIEIAERLNLSAKTIATHKYNAFQKLGVRDLASLTRLAMQYQVLDPGAV